MPKDPSGDRFGSSNQIASGGKAKPFWSWLREVTGAQWATVLMLMAVALALRLQFLGIPMRYDESFTVWRYATKSPVRIVADYSLPNNHVFHTLMVHAAIHFGGIGPGVVRLPALTAGILMVPASFLAFSRLASVTSGLFAAGLTALSPALIDYSMNARGYTLAGMLALLGLSLAIEVRRRPTRIGLWSAMAIVGALGLWTIPVFAYAWGGLLLWLAAQGASRHQLRQRLISAGVVGLASLLLATLLYSPVLIRAGPEPLVSNRFVASLSISQFLEALPGLISGLGQMWTSSVSWLLVVPIVVGAVTALLSRTNVEVRALAWSCLIGMVIVLLVSRAIPPVRTLVVVLPIIIGIAAAGLVGVVTANRQTAIRVVAGAVLVAGLGLTLFRVMAGDDRPLSENPHEFWDAEQLTLDLEPLITDGASVLAYGSPTSPLLYYFEFHDVPRSAFGPKDPGSGPVFVVVESDQAVQDVIDATGVSDWVDASSAIQLEQYEAGSLWLVPNSDSNT